MRHVSRCFLLFLFLCATSSFGFGWGCSGHQIVALIAQKQLTANARQAVLNLLSGSPIDPTLKRFCGQTTLGPLADVATWADDFRDKDPSTGNWHFWDIPLIVKEEPALTEFCDPLCVNRAIEKQLMVLRSAKAAREDKIKALMFVIHLMGDMHQPLHVISNNDRGGNCVPVNFFELQTKEGDHSSSSPNLHGVWDTSILERIAGIRRESHDADVKHFANALALRYGTQMMKWRIAPVDIEGWAWESHQLASRITYGKLPAAITPEEPVSVSTCADDNNIGQRMLALHEKIDQPYVTAASPVIERQLAKAGARLADVLNRAFAPRTSTLDQDKVTLGFPVSLNITSWQPGTVLSFTGMLFTGNVTPGAGGFQGVNVSFGGPENSLFGPAYTTMMVSGSLPASGSFSFTTYGIITAAPGLIGFTPADSATVTVSINTGQYSKTASTTGAAVSLGLPSPLPSCAFEACGPEVLCTTDVCQCELDKKRRIFNCCP